MQLDPILKESLLIILWILLLAMGAKLSLSLPLSISAVPISLQSLIVLLIGYNNRPFTACLIPALYLIIAILGLPVLADSTTGLEVLTKGSFGYLIGFIVAAPFISILKDEFRPNWVQLLIFFGIGTAVILVYGWFHLCFLIGCPDAFTKGVFPFLPGAVVKILLAVLATRIVQKYWS